MTLNYDRADDFLLEGFRDFVDEVIRLKRWVAGGAVFDDRYFGDSGKAPNEIGNADVVSAVKLSLRGRLNALRSASERMGGIPYFDEATYVMAALADETFLHLVEWEGQASWRENMLEAEMFGAQAAGQKIFENIDLILQKGDPLQRELAAVYLLALSMGFRGKFRGGDEDGARDAYRHYLYVFVIGVEGAGASRRRNVFRQAYGHTLNEGEGRRLPSTRTWAGVLLVIVLVYAAAAHVVWSVSTSPVSCLMEVDLLDKPTDSACANPSGIRWWF